MKYTKIKRLVSFGMHNNIELEAEIKEGERVEDVDLKLQKKISGLINDQEYREKLHDDVPILEQVKKDLESDIDHLTEKKRKIVDWFSNHNIPIDLLKDSEMPF